MALDLSTSASAKLEPFLLMSKSAKGAGAAKLIQDATAAPGVFVFGELLDMANIKQLEGTEHGQALTLLRLFSYGTYEEYIQQKSTLPSLSHAQVSKLRHLTLVSLALSHRILPYPLLLDTLKISSIRELEDLIIDGIYSDLIRGKLDQKAQQFEVEYAIGRDLAPGGVEALLSALNDWTTTTSTVLSTLDSQLASVASKRAASKAQEADHEERLQATLKDVSEKQHHGRERRDRHPGVGGVKTNVHPLGSGGDMMDVDESHRGPLSPQIESKLKKGFKTMGFNVSDKQPSRKRNRF